MLRAEAISKIYQMGEVEIHALRGVSLQLHSGELVVSTWCLRLGQIHPT